MQENNVGCIKCGKCCYSKYEYKPPDVNIPEIRKIEKLTGISRMEFTDTFPNVYTIYTVLKYTPMIRVICIVCFLKITKMEQKLVLYTILDRSCVDYIPGVQKNASQVE
jgi:hypothetical protein